MPAQSSNQLRNILSDPAAKEDHNAFMEKIADSKTAQDTILILSGLLKFEVLKLALMKRWRVNYGVNPNGRRKMAVPFRAKDVAAEMTEFGHPDVAICFTHLSYYYSGLTDKQLKDTFDLLEMAENPREIYDQWIQNSIPYSGVNLSDPVQRKTLFDQMRFNMHVIDFWLSKEVFPREAKMFESKLMCSAWDLCSEHLQHIVTGFSGTNDTKEVLPLPVIQSDLDELKSTNDDLRKTLQSAKNNYRSLPAKVNGMGILRELVTRGIPVLIDAGALMLELNNEQVAREWLKLTAAIENGNRYDAAIFFSKNDILMTIDHKGYITEFEYSVYRERLNRCLVYLDDVHTRGTDLKFPSGIRACVTLCGRITGDKAVQACMRMRMLSTPCDCTEEHLINCKHGHSVSFYASHEADIGIRTLGNLKSADVVNTSNVVAYIYHNSRQSEVDGLVHWSSAALNYTQKLAAHKQFEEPMDLKNLSDRCTDKENSPLAEMYGVKEIAKLHAIIRNHFNRMAHQYVGDISGWINRTGDDVVKKLQQDKIKDVERYTLLDQEHERELERECEEERQIYRPPSAEALRPHFEPKLRDIFAGAPFKISFSSLVNSNVLVKLPETLAKTKLYSALKAKKNPWSENIYATKDFLSVAKLSTVPSYDGDDEFLRPVRWIGRIRGANDDDIFVLLSQYEANQLKSTFMSSHTSILHLFCAKVLSTQSDLLNVKELQLTKIPQKSNVPIELSVQISMFAGSTYFTDQQEEAAYCNFMGYIPRSAEHEQAFDEGIITSNGFVPEENRGDFVELVGKCKFAENPDKIAIGIIERRHGYLSAKSHVAVLLTEGRKSFRKN